MNLSFDVKFFGSTKHSRHQKILDVTLPHRPATKTIPYATMATLNNLDINL